MNTRFPRPTVLTCGLLWLVIFTNLHAAHAADTARIYAVQSRLATPNFQLFLHLQADTAVASTGPLFGPAGGVYGADFLGDTLYALELANVTFVDYLATIPHEGPLRGQGARVSDQPIGFANVEALAVAEGVIYGASLDFPGHQTTLIKIHRTSGAGTAIGNSSRNVMLTGLAYDPVSKLMYGAAIRFGGAEPTAVKEPTLFIVNPATGATTPVGPLGVRLESLSWDPALGLVGAYEKLYRVNPETGAATLLGNTDFTDGKPGSGNGLYALAIYVPPLATPPRLTDISVIDGNVTLVWDATPSQAYRVESRLDLASGAWAEISPAIVASGGSASFTHLGGGNNVRRFYRVKTAP
jgi:hypothetical protein